MNLITSALIAPMLEDIIAMLESILLVMREDSITFNLLFPISGTISRRVVTGDL